MKKYYILLLLFTLFFYSCKEDQRGQYPVDSVPPGEIKSPAVVNVPGGAIISYVIPDDEDLLYVKAIYKLDNGEVMEQKASAYASSLEIVGFGKSRDVSVTLIAGDRSKNESKPVVVTAHPLDSPIYSILKSVNTNIDFGGIRLTWANPLKADVVLSVVTTNEVGEFVVAQSFYTNSETGTGNVRGYASVDRVFGVYLRDRWGNLTDTIKNTYLPLFEQEVKGKFARWNPIGIPYGAYQSPTYDIEKIWDNDITTFYLNANTPFPYSFTFDLGMLVKLSRFTVWQRQSTLYSTQNINKFQLWGSATPNVTDDFAGWTIIGDYTARKPSGSPLGTNTAEDIAYAAAGEDYTAKADSPPIRYVRFVIQASWTGAGSTAFAQMKFYGSLQ